MNKLFRLILSSMTCVGLVAGCGVRLGDGPFSNWIQADAPSWQLSENAFVHDDHSLLTTRAAGGLDAITETSGPEDYVRLALERNPAIRGAKERVERFNQRIPQAASLDDPMFMASVGDMAETAAGQVQFMVGVRQKLPFPGKLQTRGGIAAQGVAMVAQDLEATRLAVIADTRQAFWSYYFATRAIEVTEQSRTLLAQLRTIAEAKNKVGTATQQDVLRASVELSNLDNELITWRQRQTTAAAMLNSLLDWPVTAELPKPRPVEFKRVEVELERLLVQAAQSNPQLVKIRAQIEAFRRKLKLARLNRWPDLTVGLTYAAVDDEGLAPMATGEDQWWVGVGINLPIWVSKLQAAENESRRGILEGLADLNHAHNRVAFGVQDALVKVDTQQRLVILLRDVIIPQAEQTLEASFADYSTGKLGVVTLMSNWPLVSNWRNLLNFQLMYHRNLAQLEKDFAQLQQVVGRDLGRQEQPEP